MVLPARIRPALEVVEAEFDFQILVLLLDRPSLMRGAHQRAQRLRNRRLAAAASRHPESTKSIVAPVESRAR